MVQYNCERCGKEFSQKSHYNTHKGRKTLCENNADKFEQMIDKDKDGYFKSLSQADLTIRIAKDVDEYKLIAKNSFCPESSVTDSLKKKIHDCCSDIEKQLGEYIDDYLIYFYWKIPNKKIIITKQLVEQYK